MRHAFLAADGTEPSLTELRLRNAEVEVAASHEEAHLLARKLRVAFKALELIAEHNDNVMPLESPGRLDGAAEYEHGYRVRSDELRTVAIVALGRIGELK